MTGNRACKNVRLSLVLAVLAIVICGAGCATTANEPENASSKPWNSPEGWQNGNLPSNMFH